MSYVFISYSRKQLYFAESLMLDLQKNGIRTWFDLLNLSFGDDWAKTLERGYSNCDSLILIASKASLDSSYVAAEWKHARRSGKQVIIVLFENVDLPNSLKKVPVFDFRKGFNKKVKELIAYLKSERKHYDQIVYSPKISGRLAAPLSIWLITLSLIGPFLMGLLAVFSSIIGVNPLDAIRSNVNIFIPAILFLAFLVVFYIQLLRSLWLHTVSPDLLRIHSILSIFFSVIIFILPLPFSTEMIRGIATINFFLCLFTYLVVLNFSKSLLHWLYPHTNVQKLRRRIRGTNQNEYDRYYSNLTKVSKPVRYYLAYSDGDAVIAELIETTLSEYRHVRTRDEGDAERYLVVVTNHTSMKLVQHFGQSAGKNAVFILATPIAEHKVSQAALRYQWVDFRYHETYKIKLLALVLHDIDLINREQTIEAIPLPFEQMEVPSGINYLRQQVPNYIGGLFIGGLLNFTVDVPFWYGIFFIGIGIIFMFVYKRILTRAINGSIAVIIFIFAILAINSPNFFTGNVDYLRLIFILGSVIMPFHMGRYWFPSTLRFVEDQIGGLNASEINIEVFKSMSIQFLALLALFIISLFA